MATYHCRQRCWTNVASDYYYYYYYYYLQQTKTVPMPICQCQLSSFISYAWTGLYVSYSRMENEWIVFFTQHRFQLRLTMQCNYYLLLGRKQKEQNKIDDRWHTPQNKNELNWIEIESGSGSGKDNTTDGFNFPVLYCIFRNNKKGDMIIISDADLIDWLIDSFRLLMKSADCMMMVRVI